MGKMKDAYNKIKPTSRQIKKQKQQQVDEQIVNNMCVFLKEKWKIDEIDDVKFTCNHCLKIAYDSELNDINGYVTDDDLIESSNNRLRHM